MNREENKDFVVYSPSEDSELLLEVALKEVKKEDIVLEVGTGSGFVAEKLAKKCKFLVASDISYDSIKFVSKINKIKQKEFELVRADLCRCFKKIFSLIVFNPPYLELEDFEKDVYSPEMLMAIDGGKGGIEIICRFIDEVEEVMNADGRAIFIISNRSNLKEVLRNLNRKYCWKVVGKRKMFFEKLYAIKIWKI